jgi:hypothetical protein
VKLNFYVIQSILCSLILHEYFTFNSNNKKFCVFFCPLPSKSKPKSSSILCCISNSKQKNREKHFSSAVLNVYQQFFILKWSLFSPLLNALLSLKFKVKTWSMRIFFSISICTKLKEWGEQWSYREESSM